VLQKSLGRTNVPESCENYLKLVDKLNIAWEGASFPDRVSATNSAEKGERSYFKLQHRFADSRVQNPWAKDEKK
jgi:hypothetical protein